MPGEGAGLGAVGRKVAAGAERTDGAELAFIIDPRRAAKAAGQRLFSSTLAGNCERPVELTDLRASIEAGWTAAIAGDRAGVRTGLARVEAELACVEAPISESDASQIHGLEAMAALDAGDMRGADAGAAAAKRLAPSVATGRAAQSKPFADLLVGTRDTALVEDFGTSLAAVVFTDGRASATRAVGQPMVIPLHILCASGRFAARPLALLGAGAGTRRS